MIKNNEKKELGELQHLMTHRFLLEDKRLDWPSIALATYFHNLHTAEKTIFTSNKFLSEIARVNIRNMQIRLNLLEECGYIKREMHKGKRIILWVRQSPSKVIIDDNAEDDNSLKINKDIHQTELSTEPVDKDTLPMSDATRAPCRMRHTYIKEDIKDIKKINNKKSDEQFVKEKDKRQEYVSLKNKTPVYRDLTQEPEPHPHDTPEIRKKHFNKLGITTNDYDINNKNINPIAELQSLKKMLRLKQYLGT